MCTWTWEYTHCHHTKLLVDVIKCLSKETYEVQEKADPNAPHTPHDRQLLATCTRNARTKYLRVDQLCPACKDEVTGVDTFKAAWDAADKELKAREEKKLQETQQKEEQEKSAAILEAFYATHERETEGEETGGWRLRRRSGESIEGDGSEHHKTTKVSREEDIGAEEDRVVVALHAWL